MNDTRGGPLCATARREKSDCLNGGSKGADMRMTNAVSAGDLAKLVAHGDGVEVMPCATDGERCEPCSADQADMWSVYIHRDGHGVQCIGDFEIEGDYRNSAKAAAIRYAEALIKLHPQLRKHGVVVGF